MLVFNFEDVEITKKDGVKGTLSIRYAVKPADSKPDDAFTMVAEITIAPGTITTEHPHTEDEEVYIVKEGRGLYYDDDKEYAVEPGTTMILRKGHRHYVKNETDTPLVLYALIAK